MTATDRLHSEKQFHDRQAALRSLTFESNPARFVFADDTYLAHESWIRPAFESLGDIRGRSVLDYGCGHGMAAVVMARRGARVTAFDLSFGYLDEARRRAAANQVSVDFVGADGARLPFSDASFDAAWGNAVLHHLDIGVAVRELRRVLRPGGSAVFCEPWGENRWLRWARRKMHYAAKQRTADEEPLRHAHLQAIRSVFPETKVKGYQFLSMAHRVLHSGWMTAGLDWCDDQLLRRVPQLEQYCRYVVIVMRK